MKWKTAIFRFNFFIQLNSWTNKNFPDLNSKRFQVKIFPISLKRQIFTSETAWIAKKANFELVKSIFGTVPSMIMDWVLFWAILFIWLNSIDWVFVLVNWNVHIVGVFSISRTAQGSTNAPRPRLAHIYFCRMNKSVRGTLNLPNVCFSSLSRRGDWLKSLFHSILKSHELLNISSESTEKWNLVRFHYTKSSYSFCWGFRSKIGKKS